jgi:hypothetical protein
VCAVGEVLVYEGTWVGVACCWYFPFFVRGHQFVGVALFGCEEAQHDGCRIHNNPHKLVIPT